MIYGSEDTITQKHFWEDYFVSILLFSTRIRMWKENHSVDACIFQQLFANSWFRVIMSLKSFDVFYDQIIANFP